MVKMGRMRGLAPLFVLLLLTAPARAESTAEVRIQCPGLTREERDELSARLSLALRAGKDKSPRSVLVACDGPEVSIAWNAPPLELLRVRHKLGVVEDVLEAVDARLSKRPVPLPEPAIEDYEPTPGRRVFRTGGLGLGAIAEPLPFGLSLGPRWDVAVAAGALAVNLGESVRFGKVDTGPYSSFGFQLDFGLSWGAPFDPDAWFGARAGAGVDWFSIHGEREDVGTRTHSALMLSLGPRVATEAAGLSLWLGLDAVVRPNPQEFGAPVNVTLPRWSGALSVGAVLLVDDLER